ncbi:MAG: CapA family protein [Actinomycetota bacterium]
MGLRRRRRWPRVLAFVVLTLAGCSGQRPQPVRQTSPAPTPSPSPASLPATPSPAAVPQLPEDLGDFAGDFPSRVVELAAVGDVNLGARVGQAIVARGPDYPWREVAGSLRRADLAIVNFECAASKRGSPAPNKEFTFRADPASLPAMAEAGVDVASVANNHALDFGVEAFLDTLGHIREAGIEPVGGGTDEDGAWQPFYVERKGLRMAFIGATRVLPPNFAATASTPGVASAYREARLLAAVAEARPRVDLVIVMLHWGVELAPQPHREQVRLAQALVDGGAGLILGHHPHVLQPVVRYKDAVIAYSLGNFVFTSPRGDQTSMILRIGVLPDRRLVVARIPVRIVGGQPRPL